MGTLTRLLDRQHERPFCGPAVPAIRDLRPETLKPLTFFRFCFLLPLFLLLAFIGVACARFCEYAWPGVTRCQRLLPD
jgi:hypothetical protein